MQNFNNRGVDETSKENGSVFLELLTLWCILAQSTFGGFFGLWRTIASHINIQWISESDEETKALIVSSKYQTIIKHLHRIYLSKIGEVRLKILGFYNLGIFFINFFLRAQRNSFIFMSFDCTKIYCNSHENFWL